jgi:hypothetical protein
VNGRTAPGTRWFYDRGMQTGNEAEAVWGKLRGTRWNPPQAAAADPARRRTYVFALEQAEQMFRAAAGTGVATRPLLVFYGLSQAGRAIAAAAASAGAGGWELEGHGITCLSQTLRGPLPAVRVQAGKEGSTGSFVRLSELLGSPLWPRAEPLTLSLLWDLLPDNWLTSLDDTSKSRRTPLYLDHEALDPDPHPLASVPVAYFPPWLVSAADGRALDSYLRAFPDAPPCDSYHGDGREPHSVPDFTRHHDGWGELVINWRLPGGPGGLEDKLGFVRSMTRLYDGARWLFPAAGAADRSLHPLMAWWAVLYTLSMLARYQPAEWAGHINIDESRHAVAVESLLKRAMSMVPALIAEAIDQVAGTP